MMEQRQSRKPSDQHLSRSPFDARGVVGTTSALLLGWLVFGPYLLTAIGLDPYDRKKVREQVVRMLQVISAQVRTEQANGK